MKDAVVELASARSSGHFQADELQRINVDAFAKALAAAVSDDVVTQPESARLDEMLETLGLSWEAARTVHPDLVEHAFVSMINGGQLPYVDAPHIMRKKDEIVHYECQASLMKEVAVRQYQGGYSGFSFPVGKTGVRYRVGATKGHSVQVGTQLQVADTGVVSVTNKRVVYAGSRKTVEMPYSKLVNLVAYSDGIQFNLSNRVNAPLLIIPEGANIVAAIVNIAAQRVGA